MIWFIMAQMFSLWTVTPNNEIWCYSRSGVPRMVYMVDIDIAHGTSSRNHMYKNNCIIAEWPQQGDI